MLLSFGIVRLTSINVKSTIVFLRVKPSKQNNGHVLSMYISLYHVTKDISILKVYSLIDY